MKPVMAAAAASTRSARGGAGRSRPGRQRRGLRGALPPLPRPHRRLRALERSRRGPHRGPRPGDLLLRAQQPLDARASRRLPLVALPDRAQRLPRRGASAQPPGGPDPRLGGVPAARRAHRDPQPGRRPHAQPEGGAREPHAGARRTSALPARSARAARARGHVVRRDRAPDAPFQARRGERPLPRAPRPQGRVLRDSDGPAVPPDAGCSWPRSPKAWATCGSAAS